MPFWAIQSLCKSRTKDAIHLEASLVTEDVSSVVNVKCQGD